MGGIKKIGHLNHTFKAGDLGDSLDFQIYVDSHGIGYNIINFSCLSQGEHPYPYQKKRSSNPDNRRGGSDLEILVLELHQVICENSEFSYEHSELCVSLFLLRVEIKLVQAKISLRAHVQDTAVFEFNAQPRHGLGFDLITKLDLHSEHYIDRFWLPQSV